MHIGGQLVAAGCLLYGSMVSSAPLCQIDNETSLAELAKCAHSGDTDAQFALGNHFYERPGNEDNEFLAATWFLAAAKNGHIEAQYQIGLMYLDGRGVTDNAAEGFDWIAEAAKRGHTAANEVFNYLLENPQPLEC